jgi:hypothetical protein
MVTIGMLAALLLDDLRPIPPSDAAKQIGEPQALVEMTVKSAKDRLRRRGIIYLDSEEDFTDPDNLGVAISAEAAEQFKVNGIRDPAQHFKGKTIRVRGCIMRFEERLYLPVHAAEQIVIIDE